MKCNVNASLQPPVTHFSVRTKTRTCMHTATPSVLLPYVFQQHARPNDRHITLCLVLEVTFLWTFWKLESSLTMCDVMNSSNRDFRGMVLNKILMTIILCMLQQQGDSGKVRTSAALSASRQSTSTVTSSSVPAPSKPQTLSEEENVSNDGTQDSSKVRQN